MSAKQPLPLYIFVSVFLVTIGMVSLSLQLLHEPQATPRTLMELAELLSRNAPSLYVVPVMENEPESGIYICTQPQPREQLFKLLRGPELVCKCKWQGVVYCEMDGALCGVIEEQIIQGWGEHCMRIGPLLFFGDPTLLRGIYKLILESHEGNAARDSKAQETCQTLLHEPT